MKHLSSITLLLSFIFISYIGNSATQFQNKPGDSTFFEKNKVYLTFSPVTLSSSYNLNSDKYFPLFSGRIGVNLMSKKYWKFQVFGMRGAGAKLFDPSKATVTEFGVTIGKLFRDKNSGFWDLNAGISYFGSETRTKENYGSFWDGTSASSVKTEEGHTFGIPFEAMFYGSKLPVGFGIGIVGNLNIEQPHVGISARIRFGNPKLK